MRASVFATPTPAMPEDTPPPTASPPESASHSAPPRRRWLGALVALLIVGALGGSAWYFVERSKKPPETAQGPGVRPLDLAESGHVRQNDIALVEEREDVAPVVAVAELARIAGTPETVEGVVGRERLTEFPITPVVGAARNAVGQEAEQEVLRKVARDGLPELRELTGRVGTVGSGDVETRKP